MRRQLALTLLIGGCASSSQATAPATAAATPPPEVPAPEPEPAPEPAPPPLAQAPGNGPAPLETEPRGDADAAKNTGILGAAVSISVAFTPPIVSKGGDAKAIAGTLTANEGAFWACGTAPHSAQTTMTLTFRIDPSGKVLRASATGDKQLDACVAHMLEGLAFPAARVAVDVVEKADVKPADFSSGFDDTDIYGGLVGDTKGTTGWGTIGTGRYGTIGHGSGTSAGGYGVGHGGKVPAVSLGQPTAKGDLDRALIRRYIRRNIQKIEYCYEKELVKTPKLAGTATVTFHIGPNGTVTSSVGSGFAKVDECVARTVGDIEFPRPKSGEVDVVYPFVFRPAT